MAFIDHDKKKQLTPRIRHVLKTYGFKGSIGICNYSTLTVTIHSGRLDLIQAVNDGLERAAQFNGVPAQSFTGYCSVSQCQLDSGLLRGDALAFMCELSEAMNAGNHNDALTDYFSTGWYTEINIGRWNRPFVVTIPNTEQA